MSTRPLPPALEPYLRLPPEASLILLTGTLGCSVNWLTSRFVSSILANDPSSEGESDHAVLLVSWLRDLAFWKNEIRRGTGLDISRLTQSGRFAFVDCFSQATNLAQAEKAITEAINKLKDKKILLILDSPDVLLATASTTTQDLNLLLLKLRSQVHTAIVTCSADLPLVSAAVSSSETQPTPIEAESAAFVTTQAHAARLVMSVRELDTGAARDVSGVLRITRGGSSHTFDEDEDQVSEGEMLYLVHRDGNVNVFNRGTDIS